MNPTVGAAVVSAVAAVVAATIAYLGVVRGKRADRELAIRVKQLEADLASQKAEADRRAETEQLARKFREPLAHAAYDLQSRIYNILKSDFLESYLKNGNSRTQLYAAKNTLFLIAQYFAWTELVRREIQYIESGTDKETRCLAGLRNEIYAIWQSNDYDPLFRIFAGEQRAIGERLIREDQGGEPRCMGYASFVDFYKEHPDPLLSDLEAEIKSLGTSLEQARPRLVALQHALVDLLAFLDPDFVRFPQQTRTKLEG